MKVELLNTQYSNQNSLAFKADIFIDGRQIGTAKNTGDGSGTSYIIFSKNDTDKLLNFCEKIPPESVYLNSVKILEIKMNIEKLINTLLQSQKSISVD